jgi:hypothetical protein
MSAGNALNPQLMNQFGSQMTMGAQNQTAFGTTQPMSLPFGQQQMAA